MCLFIRVIRVSYNCRYMIYCLIWQTRLYRPLGFSIQSRLKENEVVEFGKTSELASV
jgi:hypothetical protein